MSTTPDTTAPGGRDDDSIPLWLEALARAPWGLFFPTCSSYLLSETRRSRRPRRPPQVTP